MDEDLKGVGPFDWYFARLRGGDKEQKRKLLSEKPINDIINNHNSTLLQYAISSNYSLEVIQALLNNGANPNLADSLGNTAFHYALYKYDSEITEAMLKSGADHARKDKSGRAALHITAMTCDAACAKLLIEAGTDVNAQDIKGNTPLHIAIDIAMAISSRDDEYEFGYLEEFLWVLLASKKLDISVYNSKNETVLLKAAKLKNVYISLLLLLYTTSLNISGLNDFIIDTPERKMQPSFSMHYINNSFDQSSSLEMPHLVEQTSKLNMLYAQTIQLKNALALDLEFMVEKPILIAGVNTFKYYCFDCKPNLENLKEFWTKMSEIRRVLNFLRFDFPFLVTAFGQEFLVTKDILACIFLCTGDLTNQSPAWLPDEIRILLIEHYLQLSEGIFVHVNSANNSQHI